MQTEIIHKTEIKQKTSTRYWKRNSSPVHVYEVA